MSTSKCKQRKCFFVCDKLTKGAKNIGSATRDDKQWISNYFPNCWSNNTQEVWFHGWETNMYSSYILAKWKNSWCIANGTIIANTDVVLCFEFGDMNDSKHNNPILCNVDEGWATSQDYKI